MEKYTLKEHFLELKKRFIVILLGFLACFAVCYCYSEEIYQFLLSPLVKADLKQPRKIIYTGMTEAFFTYIKLGSWGAFMLIIPIIAYQTYAFIAPGLHKSEKQLILPTLIIAPILFYLGGMFVFFIVMPTAWQFFLSFENNSGSFPIALEPRISEYLSIVMQLTTAFGLAFQLPVVILVLSVLQMVAADSLKKKRRIAIVIIFILAAIFTPPDVLSQIALALPLILLYEISIIICKFVEKRNKGNARYQVD